MLTTVEQQQMPRKRTIFESQHLKDGMDDGNNDSQPEQVGVRLQESFLKNRQKLNELVQHYKQRENWLPALNFS